MYDGKVARLGRFERPTSGSGDQRSIQLSYRRVAESFATRHTNLILPCFPSFFARISSGVIPWLGP